MTINLLILYNDSCPSFESAIERIKEIAKENNLNLDINTQLLKSEQEAKNWKFSGSPTIYINNTQFDPIDAEIYRVDNCRIYTNDDGKISPLPPKNKLFKALLEA